MCLWFLKFKTKSRQEYKRIKKKSIASKIQHLNMKHFISRHMHQKKNTGCTQ